MTPRRLPLVALLACLLASLFLPAIASAGMVTGTKTRVADFDLPAELASALRVPGTRTRTGSAGSPAGRTRWRPETASYSPWGEQLTGEPGAFGFQGLRNEVLGESGVLVSAMLRHASPRLGRWISRDPGGFIDGQNRHTWLFNGPSRYLDPTGLASFEEIVFDGALPDEGTAISAGVGGVLGGIAGAPGGPAGVVAGFTKGAIEGASAYQKFKAAKAAWQIARGEIAVAEFGSGLSEADQEEIRDDFQTLGAAEADLGGGLSGLAGALNRGISKVLQSAGLKPPAACAPPRRLRRPKLRVGTRAAIGAAAPRDPLGRPIDPNLRTPIVGTPHYGHKAGDEFWRWRDLAEAADLTQAQFNDLMNDPSLYQLEDPLSNMSHQWEMPGW